MTILSLLACLASAQEETRIADLIRALDADEFEVRIRAATELRKIRKPALAPLHRMLERSPSAEAREGAEGIIRRIVEDIRTELMARYSGERGLRCGFVHFLGEAQTRRLTPSLEKFFPGCSFLVGHYSCIHRVALCSGEWVIAISRREGRIFTIRNTNPSDPAPLGLGDVDAIARHLAPVRSKEEALEAALLVAEESNPPAYKDPGLGTVAAESAEGLKVTANVMRRNRDGTITTIEVTFDKEGRLLAIEQKRHPREK